MIQRLRQMRNEEGFTLIELLIVIIVLGILAAIVVFAVGTTRSDAIESTCKSAVNSVQLSGEAVKTKGGSYPAADEDAFLADSTRGGMLKAWPAESNADFDLNWTGTDVQVINNKVDPPAAVGIGEAGCTALP